MAATAAQAAPNGQAGAPDELATSDEVKEYCHEGEGENTEHLNSMDLHDIKTELEKDAEAEEVSVFIPIESTLLPLTRVEQTVCSILRVGGM